MDAPQPKMKPIGYESMKAILRYADLKFRSRLARRIPAVRTANSTLPFYLDEVCMASDYLGVDKRCWNFWEVHDGENEDADGNFIVVPGMCHARFGVPHEDSDEERIQKLYITKEVAMERLVRHFIRRGSHIRKMVMWSVPPGLDVRNLKLFVTEFQMEHSEYQYFKELEPCLHEDSKFRKVKFIVREDSKKMLAEPRVQSAMRLKLQFPYYDPIPVGDMLLDLKNKEIYVLHIGFPIDKIYELAMHWISMKRKIGTTFWLTIEQYTYVLDVFEYFQAKLEEGKCFPSKVIALEDQFFAHSLTVPIDENSSLVLFGGLMIETWKPFQWTFRMEIMKKDAVIAKEENVNV